MDAMAEFAMAANPNVSRAARARSEAKEEFYAYYRRLTPIGYANSLRALLAMDHITDQLLADPRADAAHRRRPRSRRWRR